MERLDRLSSDLFEKAVQLVESCTRHIHQQLSLAAALMPLRIPEREVQLARIEQLRARGQGLLTAAQFVLKHLPPDPSERKMPCFNLQSSSASEAED
jgi:hypothetical protein